MVNYIVYQQIKGMFWVPGLGSIKSQDAPNWMDFGEAGEGCATQKSQHGARHNVSNVQNHHEILIFS